MVQETGLREALISETWIPSEHGEAYKAGDQIRGLAQLEQQERRFCADLSVKGIAADLAEREIRLAERQGEQMMAGRRAKGTAGTSLRRVPQALL